MFQEEGSFQYEISMKTLKLHIFPCNVINKNSKASYLSI
jgi:hypothetical protein